MSKIKKQTFFAKTTSLKQELFVINGASRIHLDTNRAVRNSGVTIRWFRMRAFQAKKNHS
jgi:hypothetical protein